MQQAPLGFPSRRFTSGSAHLHCKQEVHRIDVSRTSLDQLKVIWIGSWDTFSLGDHASVALRSLGRWDDTSIYANQPKCGIQGDGCIWRGVQASALEFQTRASPDISRRKTSRHLCGSQSFISVLGPFCRPNRRSTGQADKGQAAQREAAFSHRTLKLGHS